jgi:hypothetical protein
MRAWTRAGLLTRLERLECRVAQATLPSKRRFGHLKRLAREYQGERHAIVARELPKQGDQEWVEYEEVPGPDPDPPQQLARGIPQRIECHVRGALSQNRRRPRSFGGQVT